MELSPSPSHPHPRAGDALPARPVSGWMGHSHQTEGQAQTPTVGDEGPRKAFRPLCATAHVPAVFKLPGQRMPPLVHSRPTGRGFPAPRDGASQPHSLGRVSGSLVPCQALGCGTLRRSLQAAWWRGAAFPCRLPCAAWWLAAGDSQATVPCATWLCPSRNKAPYLFTHGAQAALPQLPPPSPPSPPESRGCAGVGTSLHASPWPSCLCTVGSLSMGSLWHSHASQSSLPDGAGTPPGARQHPPSPHCLTPHHPIEVLSLGRAVFPDGRSSSHLDAAMVWGCWRDAGGGQPVLGPLQELQPPLRSGVRGQDTQNTPLGCGTHERCDDAAQTGQVPSAQQCPKSHATRAGEVGYPQELNPFMEAGGGGECCEWPDLCVATDNYSSFIICQADGPGRALQYISGFPSQPINLSSAQ